MTGKNKFANMLMSVVLISLAPITILADSHGHAYIIEPQDGATVKNPVKVLFGLDNAWGIAPAGVVIDKTGHHHLLIDTDLPSDLTKPIAKDAQHRHFGGGQTETHIDLTPGTHTLQLLLGNFAHIPHSTPVLSKRITITVE